MFSHKFRLSLKKIVGYVNEFNQPVICRKQFLVTCHHDTTKNECSQSRLEHPNVSFCTHQPPNNANVFGDISGRKFEHYEMDELEKEEENFQDTEARVPRRFKPSLGQYANMVKSHICKTDLDSALKVLDLMKENRDKPTIYIYNLLLRAFSRQGNIKRCFSLYNKAKKHGLQPNAATYTCLFNACAMSDKSALALEHIDELRRTLYEKEFLLNQTHYNVMVKAYGWHKRIADAFQLVDEMMDKRIAIGEATYNSLLHTAIADKEAGLRHALIVWHLMRRWRIKPTLLTYNLFLRVIRDTNLGDVKINEVLLSGYEQTRILLKEGERPDLLASPPILSNLLLSGGTGKTIIQQRDSNADRQNIPSETLINLNDVLANNRLILFGGLEGILDRMAKDDVKPSAKTITLLLDLIPNTVSAENLLIKTADEKNITLDIDFFNMLIRRRSLRYEYKAAKEVMSMAEQRRLSPNVMTFGVLALGCQEYKEAEEFLAGIEAFGYKPNVIIMGTLLRTACNKQNFGYLFLIMDYMMENRIKPNEQTIEMLEKFSRGISKIEKPLGRYRLRKLRRLEKNIEKFEQKYPKWQKMITE